MPILYLNFRALPFEQQLPLVWAEGTYLGRRWEAGQAVTLYLMDGGFLCELSLWQEACLGPRVWSFATTDTERLEKYSCYIQLDDLLDTDS